MRKRNLLAVGVIAVLSLTACSNESSTEETTTTAGIVSGDNSVVKAETETVTQEETSGEGDTTEAVTESTTTVAEENNGDVLYTVTGAYRHLSTGTLTTVKVDLLSPTLHGFEMKDGSSNAYEYVNDEGVLSYVSVEVYVRKSLLHPENSTENAEGYFVRYNMDGDNYYGNLFDDMDNPTYDIKVTFHDMNGEFGGDATKMADIVDELIANMNITVEVTDIE
jgi:hypothetical protein